MKKPKSPIDKTPITKAELDYFDRQDSLEMIYDLCVEYVEGVKKEATAEELVGEILDLTFEFIDSSNL